MKKILLIAIAGLTVVAILGAIVVRTIAAKEEWKKAEVSPRAAKSLQDKIDTIKNAEDNPDHKRGTSRVELVSAELESYLLYSLKEDIPAQVDSAEVRLAQDSVSLDTQITFSSGATGNPVFDALLGGTHSLFLKAKLTAQESQGKFDLQEVRVDGIPVPNVLIQALIKRYVTPKYPQVDLNEPFEMPWGVEELKLEDGKAIVVY